ncbi:hypothetical protein DICPUDRAFT_153785 [Dictyostelium purpureum]|uniref:Poly [ADP-ribose] polymerase n=1 Tax=Dictyostelium purpureum TaxID=5786 RepID=F0ZPR3_DICPU|nr:uncharacterized protein DICPUDRAFT_153785 [Dictyostelium purpureum]EGC34079.1 hypothetical protein DICPUDRAFT_153785 [Dictyostelium purpureum]|eukprot:XP_003289409.1 hypothetical protein DICPUDRAFT_153785 [Dictyostelium purpureum]
MKVLNKTIQEHGGIDVVVNNIGYGLLGVVEELSVEDIQNIYEVKVFGESNVLRHTNPYLRAQGSGLVLNISSYLGYSALGAFSQSLHNQYSFNGNENQSLYEEIFLSTWAKYDCGRPTSIRYIQFDDNYYQKHKKNYDTLIIPKNEKILFHGTPNTCLIINCGRCSACGIKESGFKISFSGKNISFSRFGRGIYLAPNSSKANDYNNNQNFNYRCTIVSKVNLGNSVRLFNTNQQISLPNGYHSVHGQAGFDLNYDEYVVYNEKQVLPIGVFIYVIS